MREIYETAFEDVQIVCTTGLVAANNNDLKEWHKVVLP